MKTKQHMIHLAAMAVLVTCGNAAELHVAITGSDASPGTQAAPLRTIQRAADLAQPGDTVTVHAGVYRERINPPRGGESDAKRIVYQAASGEQVVITGSEEVKKWEKVQDNVWKATLPSTFFGSFNPFAELIAGDWFHDNNRRHHAGAVYLNGHWLAEAVSMDEVLKPMTATPLWFASVDTTNTVIWAQFKDVDPNAQQVEVNARQSVFYPDKPGRNYITVRGFTLRNAATPWAPPTVEQIGLIGVHWSKGWLIESNDIAYSTCSGITLGKYGEAQDKNSGSAKGYVTTIERGLKNGWNKETIGHHVVRNNHISHCEQAGIVGSLGAAFSTVTGNTIHDIHVRQLFSGAEMAGIKFHGPIDTTISGNHIYRTCRGIWLDWMTQGARITGNLCHDNATHDLFVEVNHGPFVVDNNLFLSPKAIEDDSQGGAYTHNLIAGGIDLNPTFFDGRKTPFHKAHSTEVVALHDNPSGDNHYYNNLFMRSGSLEKYDQAHLPMWMDGNVFFQGAKSSKHESAPINRSASDPGLTLVEKNDGFYLTMTLPTALGSERPSQPVTSARLGKASISDCAFENPDGSPITIGTDYFGKPRNADNPTPGPFEAPGTGTVTMKVWPLTVGEKALVTGLGPAGKAELLKKPIRAFCVDFNWQVKGAFRFAAPGDWADADPAAQVKWCKEAGVNCIQTFILSCNGYAWYKGGPISEQPGLKHDFLTEVAKQGHQQKMLVMGYYCISANSLWGKNHPDQSYDTPSTHHIPLTKDYVEYLCRSVRDVLKRTEIDGFMLDWMQNTSGKWLDCEKTMYAELMGVPFPGADKVTAADKAAFDQKAVERCWTSIRDAARGVKPDCILWPNFLHHLNLEGVDWLLNEGPDPREIEAAEQRLGGRPVRLIQNQVGWPNHDARKVFSKSKYNTWDFYGFAAPYDNGLPLPVADYLGKPIDEFKGTDRMAINDKNIAALVRFYLGKPVESAASETALSCGKPATASSTWGAGFEADKAVDGDDESRWGAAPKTRSGWLEVDLGKDTAVDCAVIKELGHHRTEAFAVECKAGDNWKELIKGSTIAGEKVLKFTPVTARYFRLNILKANEVPTIEEFQLYAPGTKITATAEKPRDPKLKWFDEAKYGLFINWGLYSIPAGEWKGKKYDSIGEWIMYDAKIPAKEYRELAKQFNPQKFNAEEWAQLAEDAGMKYLVFDCKHHDGFALYKSAVSKYNCYDATPWKRDPFKELQEACKKRNIKLCFYYSHAADWNEPNGGMNDWDFKPDTEKDFDQYLRDKSMPQVTELLKNYGSIGLIWFDMQVMMTPERSKKLADLVRSIQPDVLINSRLGEGKYHDYRSMGDNEIPNLTMAGAWETAATVNDTWGYKKDDYNWKQPDNITFKLVDIASKGGNYLLNVGPDADGFIPQPSQDILRKVGKWLKVNGEAVYGAGRTPFGDELGKYDPEKKDNRGRPVFNETTDWRCTVKPMDWTWGKAGKLYLHLFKWPGARFELAGFNGKVEKAYMLADPDRTVLKHSVTEGKLTIELPEKATDEIDSVLCIELQK